MNISRKNFVFLFIIFGFVFMFVATSLFGSTGPRGFPKQPDTLLTTASPEAWKITGSKIIVPIKVVLMGPLLLSKNFLQEDPPPPFVGLYFIFYWSILASIIYYIVGKLKKS